MRRLTLLVTTIILGWGCGLVPLEPLAPLGCSRLKPVCICDKEADNCEWQWVCVEDE